MIQIHITNIKYAHALTLIYLSSEITDNLPFTKMRRKIYRTCVVNIPTHGLLLKNLIHKLYIKLATIHACIDRILLGRRQLSFQNVGDTLKHYLNDKQNWEHFQQSLIRNSSGS